MKELAKELREKMESKDKLKMIKDIPKEEKFGRNCFSVRYGHRRLLAEDKIKELAIKWVKEELKEGFNGQPGSQLDRWMKRLNISEEDLDGKE